MVTFHVIYSTLVKWNQETYLFNFINSTASADVLELLFAKISAHTIMTKYWFPQIYETYTMCRAKWRVWAERIMLFVTWLPEAIVHHCVIWFPNESVFLNMLIHNAIKASGRHFLPLNEYHLTKRYKRYSPSFYLRKINCFILAFVLFILKISFENSRFAL